MLVKNVIRGNSITFTSSFLDANNNIMIPQAPTVTLYFKSNNVYVNTSISMTASGNTWSASWNTSNADVGIVQWHISGGPTTPSALDGDFRVLANRANGGPGAS